MTVQAVTDAAELLAELRVAIGNQLPAVLMALRNMNATAYHMARGKEPTPLFFEDAWQETFDALLAQLAEYEDGT